MKFLLFLILCICSGHISAQNPASKTQNNSNEVQKTYEVIVPDIPKDTWEKIFFESIDERTDEAQIKSLRKTKLADDDLEIRIWKGFGLMRLEGFILKRINKNWSAIHIDTNYVSGKVVNENKQLNKPKAGWEAAWKKLLDAEILTLPDASSIDCDSGLEDGTSYVVELKKGENYRTYMYDNPDRVSESKCAEIKKVLEIIKIITQDYNFK